MDFNVVQYYKFMGRPVPNTDDPQYKSILEVGNFVKSEIEKRIGTIDYQEMDFELNGTNLGYLKLPIQTVRIVNSVRFLSTYDYTTRIDMPMGSIIFNISDGTLQRNKYYENMPDYLSAPYDIQDPKMIFPKIFGMNNIFINAIVGYENYESLPKWIATNWVLCVQELRDISPLRPLSQAQLNFQWEAYDYEKIINIIANRFSPERGSSFDII